MEILTMLGITERHYHEIFFEVGCRVIEGKYCNPERILYHALFWNWLKNQRDIVDKDFIEQCKYMKAMWYTR